MHFEPIFGYDGPKLMKITTMGQISPSGHPI